ncbi:hypothetical protein DIU36_20075 [Mucilaginibacter rubeus]|nr:hypothetical protein DIU36_20075 [Mucilaginibacter rubeus]
MAFVLTFVSVVLVQCTFNNIRINAAEDNNDGKAFLNMYYSKVKAKDYNSLDNMLSDSLKRLTGNNGFSKMLIFINSKVSTYNSYKIEDYYVRRITGSVNEISYNYKLKVTYQKGTTEEIIGFKRLNGGLIKVNSYHAYSDLLIH